MASITIKTDEICSVHDAIEAVKEFIFLKQYGHHTMRPITVRSGWVLAVKELNREDELFTCNGDFIVITVSPCE